MTILTKDMVVYSNKEGFGVVLDIPTHVDGEPIFVVCFANGDERYSFYYDKNGARYLRDVPEGQRVRELWPANEYMDIHGKLLSECRAYRNIDILLGDNMFDLAMGWGTIVEINHVNRLFTVQFTGENNVLWKLTYSFDGKLASGKGRYRRVFKPSELSELSFLSTEAELLYSMKPGNFNEETDAIYDKVRSIVVGAPEKNNADTVGTWLFFYQPNERGFCKNVLIGRGLGTTLKEAFASLHKFKGSDGQSRLDVLAEKVKEGKVQHLFAYRASNICAIDKATVLEIERGMGMKTMAGALRHPYEVVLRLKD